MCVYFFFFPIIEFDTNSDTCYCQRADFKTRILLMRGKDLSGILEDMAHPTTL